LQEILRASRTSVEQDYLVRTRVADVAAYDQFCKRLIKRIDLEDVSASCIMEEIKETTALPIP
jgi:Lrp/AsnC family transcriptional regulator